MKIALMGTAGQVIGLERFTLADRIRIVGQNTGNLVFQYAASRMIDAEQVVVGSMMNNWTDPVLRAGAATALVFPAANMLRTGTDWTDLNNFLERAKLPLVIFGLGVQGEHAADAAGLVASLRASPTVVRMVEILRDKAVFVGVRGQLTAAVCEAMGLHGVHVLGCPSLTISPELQLGQRIAARLAALRQAGDRPRLVVTAAAPWEVRGRKRELERRLIELIEPGDLYVQQSGGPQAILLASDGPDSIPAADMSSAREILMPGRTDADFADWTRRHTRIFFSTPAWMEATATADLFIGTRLHGNVVGLQQGIPAAVIAHDARTSELIGQMCLPSLELDRFMAAPSLREAVQAIEFDADAFDAERARVAAVYRDRLGAIGLRVSPHVLRLAEGARAAVAAC